MALSLPDSASSALFELTTDEADAGAKGGQGRLEAIAGSNGVESRRAQRGGVSWIKLRQTVIGRRGKKSYVLIATGHCR